MVIQATKGDLLGCDIYICIYIYIYISGQIIIIH